MKYLHFYATATDILPVLKRFEQGHAVKYIEDGKRVEINRPIYLECRELPDIGISSNESGSLSTTYIVSERVTKNFMYEFKNDKGLKRWLLSNGDNPDSVVLTMAGRWKTGTLLPGNMSTLHSTPAAQLLMRRFSTAVKQEKFVRYGVYWFGREAIEMLKAGRRLVQSEQSPPSFDVLPPKYW